MVEAQPWMPSSTPVHTGTPSVLHLVLSRRQKVWGPGCSLCHGGGVRDVLHLSLLKGQGASPLSGSAGRAGVSRVSTHQHTWDAVLSEDKSASRTPLQLLNLNL